jgi:hypothetical protein
VTGDGEPTRDSMARARSPWTLAVIGLALIAAGAALVATLWLGLNGDVQYVFGGLATHASEDPLGFVKTFTHRPVAYRGILDAILGVAGLVSVPAADPVAFEVAVRLIGITLAGATGLTVSLGLRRRTDPLVATGAGIGVGAALALAPNFDFLQAEWFAAAFAAAGVGVALGTRRPWVGAALGGILLTLAVGVKLSTIALAPAAVLVIATMDRRRAGLTTGAGLVAGMAWLGLSFATPREWQWLQDIVAASPDSLVSGGLSAERIGEILKILESKLAVTPILVTAPASIALLAARRPDGMRLAALLTGAVILTLSPLIVQAPPNLYNLAAAHVLASGLLGAATVRWWRLSGRIPWLALAPLGACIAVALWALSAGPEWLDPYRPAVTGLLALAAVLGLGAAGVLITRSKSHATPRASGGVVTLASFVVIATLAYLPTVVPAAAWALRPEVTPYTNTGWADEAAASASALRALSGELDADDEVLYLAFGTAPYGLGAPTPCRYPSPLFLQRSVLHASVAELSSYADSLRCLQAADVDALLIEPRWARVSRQSPVVRELIRRRFACGMGVEIGEYVLCPRR